MGRYAEGDGLPSRRLTLFVDVAFPRPLLRNYTYAVPEQWSASARPGVRVTASLGRQIATGVVVRVHDVPPEAVTTVKNITAILDDLPVLPESILAFTRKLADYQATSWGALLGLALPPAPALPLKRRVSRRLPDPPAQLALGLETTSAVASTAVEIGRAIQSGEHAEFLAWGGKGAQGALITEASRAAVDRSRNVLILVADIARAENLRRRLQTELGTMPALLHGRMTPRAQATEWDRVRRGEARLILGSRAALFKPWPGLGLIVVEDESDDLHFQSDSPAYDVRRGAQFRAEEEKAVLLYTAGAPTVSSYARARAAGTLRVLGGEDPAPAVRVSDETAEKGVLTRPMREGLAGCLASGGRAIVFLNRRGYASLLFCPRCGFIPRCGKCGAVSSYHKNKDRLICHTCGTEEKRPGACPSCEHRVLEPRGGGVEALEEVLKIAFPKARIAVFDRDRAGRTIARAEILQAYESNRIDILIGTQMLSRREELPPADFVGIFNPEAGLAAADFGASERTFQTLVRMIRFAIPGEPGTGIRRSGEKPAVVVQTGFPEHHSIRAASRMDYEAFFSEEIELRRLLGLPPFAASAEIVLEGREVRILGGAARTMASRWREAGREIEVLGPSFISETGGMGLKRIQVVLRADKSENITAVLSAGLREAGPDYAVIRSDGLIR